MRHGTSDSTRTRMPSLAFPTSGGVSFIPCQDLKSLLRRNSRINNVVSGEPAICLSEAFLQKSDEVPCTNGSRIGGSRMILDCVLGYFLETVSGHTHLTQLGGEVEPLG